MSATLSAARVEGTSIARHNPKMETMVFGMILNYLLSDMIQDTNVQDVNPWFMNPFRNPSPNRKPRKVLRRWEIYCRNWPVLQVGLPDHHKFRFADSFLCHKQLTINIKHQFNP